MPPEEVVLLINGMNYDFLQPSSIISIIYFWNMDHFLKTVCQYQLEKMKINILWECSKMESRYMILWTPSL